MNRVKLVPYQGTKIEKKSHNVRKDVYEEYKVLNIDPKDAQGEKQIFCMHMALASALMLMDNYLVGIQLGAEACRRVETLLGEIKKLPTAEQSRARACVKTHEGQVPEKILLPLVYWKFVKKSAVNESKVLQYWLQTRLQALRDYADHPLKKDKAAQSAARTLMTSMRR